MSKIRKWSELLAESKALPSKIFRPGEMYEYDDINLPKPTNISLLFKGDILVLKKEPGLTAYLVPGHKDDWRVIKSTESTSGQMNSFTNVNPGDVVANMGNSTKPFPKTPIVNLFKKLPLSLLLDVYGYGICRNRNNTDPTWTPCGNHMLQITMPFHTGMRRCLVDDGGGVVACLDPQDSTKLEDGNPADLSAERFQVMVEIPACYRYHFVADNIEYVYLSDQDFEVDENVLKSRIPDGTFISAFEAIMDQHYSERPILASGINRTDEFIGGDGIAEHAEWTGEKDLRGRPKTNLSLAKFREAAHNRGQGWYSLAHPIYNHICWLFFIEKLTFNSQAVDLGEGVTNWTSAAWNTFNSYNPFVPCGITTQIGNASGKVQYDITGLTTHVPSYRGIENPFGHIWKWTDGILAKAANGVIKVYVCDDPHLFSDEINEGYREIGHLPTSNNYYKQNIPGYVLPTAESPTATATTGLCDYFYAPSANAGVRGLLFGGLAFSGTYAGLSCASALNAPSYAAAYIGSRLCFIPE